MNDTYGLSESTIRYFVKNYKDNVEYFDKMIEKTTAKSEKSITKQWVFLKKVACDSREKVDFT